MESHFSLHIIASVLLQHDKYRFSWLSHSVVKYFLFDTLLNEDDKK